MQYMSVYDMQRALDDELTVSTPYAIVQRLKEAGIVDEAEAMYYRRLDKKSFIEQVTELVFNFSRN